MAVASCWPFAGERPFEQLQGLGDGCKAYGGAADIAEAAFHVARQMSPVMGGKVHEANGL